MVSKKITGEGIDCPDHSDLLENTLKPLLQDYEPTDIYNADETSFFYKALTNRTYAFGNETVCVSRYLNSKDLLLIDNAPSHITKQYSNIRVQFLPQNTSSKLHPLNQGIIPVCNLQYHTLLNTKLCKIMDTEKDLQKVMKGLVL